MIICNKALLYNSEQEGFIGLKDRILPQIDFKAKKHKTKQKKLGYGRGFIDSPNIKNTDVD